MKREELRQWFVEWLDDYYDELHSEDDLTPEVAESVLTALRPVSREQVVKVWRGEWINKHSAYDHKIFTCARCGKRISIQGENLNFCPKCGSAQTDKAVDILLKRLEALKDGSTTD